MSGRHCVTLTLAAASASVLHGAASTCGASTLCAETPPVGNSAQANEASRTVRTAESAVFMTKLKVKCAVSARLVESGECIAIRADISFILGTEPVKK